MRIYLDHNATTPPAAEVVDRMAAALREQFGNPSSVHHFGQVAKAALDDARSAAAALVGGDPSEIVFTSSGTGAARNVVFCNSRLRVCRARSREVS